MQAIERAREGQATEALLARVHGDGSAAHPYLASETLRSGPEAVRNLADAAHHLCMLHGRLPGVIDHAVARVRQPGARIWMEAAAGAFAEERSLLTRLAVATGPLPSTPGQAECEAAVLQQRHALAMLAQSERDGCALGAAVALVLDWQAIRIVLDAAAKRVSIEPLPCRLPDAAALDLSAPAPAFERAFAFGSQQLLAQHRGLWDLLEAREAARARL